jgi:Virulence-associated protein E
VTLAYDDGETYTVEALQQALEPYWGKAARGGRSGGNTQGSKSRVKSEGSNDYLSGGMKREYPPANIDEVAKDCPFVADTLAAGGANLVDDHQWHAVVALSCHCGDPSKTVHRLCEKNQHYDYDGCEAKLMTAQQQRDANASVGPPKCEHIKRVSAPQCATCPHFVLGTTPLSVGTFTPAVIVTPVGTIVSPLRGKGVYARVHDYLLGAHIFSYDEFACRMFIDGKDWDEETAVQLLDEYIGKHPANKEPTIKIIEQAAFSLSRTNKVNSVVDYLNGLKWDGVKRIDSWLIDYCGAEDTPLNRGISRKFMVSFVKRPLKPGSKLDTMLVLEGKQGKGKSSVFAILAGAPDRFFDGLIIHENGKEQQALLQGVWAVEIAELSDFRRGDINKVNSFLSRTHDRARVLYTNIPINRARTCVIAGTTNEHQYLLNDENRRFWCVLIGAIFLSELARDRDQLLAEAVAAFKHGEDAVLPKELWGVAAEMQMKRRIRDDWEDLLASALEYPPPKSNSGVHRLAVEEIIYGGRTVLFIPSTILSTQVLGLAAKDMRGQTSHRLAAVMRRLEWQKGRKKGKGRGYIRALPGEAALPDGFGELDENEDAIDDGVAAAPEASRSLH